MSRYSYDDMPPEGYREKHRGSGRMTAAIASIGVLLTLIAVIIYLLFAPQKEASEEDPGRTSSIAVTPAQPEIIESMEQSVELPQASEAPREERIVAASDRFQQIPFTDYTVQDGDTLTSVAESFSLSTSTIVSVNGLTETTLEAGMVLRIPPVNGTLYEVEEGDTLSAIASMRNPELSASDLAALNGKPYTAVVPGDEIFIPAPGTLVQSSAHIFSSPLPGGTVIARFGDLVDGHPLDGIVIASAPGSAVLAAADGVVVDLFSDDEFGRSVRLLHENGYTTDYHALESISVKVSQSVEAGDAIGAVGTMNGIFSEPAVVFVTEQNSVPLDPENLTDF